MNDWDSGSVSGNLAEGSACASASLGDSGKCLDDARDYKSTRRWPRYAVDMPVEVRVTTQGPTRMVACQGQGTDLSCGGLAVTADIDLPIGAQIGVEFIPPYSDQSVKFRCFVRNRDGIRYGVEFITENDDDYRKAGELQEGLAAIGTLTRECAEDAITTSSDS